MQKKVLQDIHTPGSGGEMERPSRKWDYGGGDGITKSSDENQNGSVEQTSEQQPYQGGPRKPRKQRSGVSPLWWGLGGIVLVVVLVVLVWSFFSTATVQVVLSQQITTINDTFSAIRSSEDDGVPYQIVKLEEKATKGVSPTGEDEVTRKASGQIVVYSEYGDTMRFVVNTRFQAPDGKIYRVDKPVSIPGAKKDSEGELVPGSIEVTVYADQPGEEYNTGLVDFTVPGLLDTDLYDKFYARSKTEITGGFDGVLKYASEEDVENASQELQEEIRQKLLSDIGSFIGEDRVLYDDAVFINFSTDVPTDVSASGLLEVTETGLLRAFVFDRGEISKAIAQNSLSSYDDSPVIVKNLEELTFVFEDKDDFDVNLSETFTFTLSGNPHIVWEIDVETFKNDLAGMSEDDKKSIAEKYPSVRKVEASIKPFWRSSFPDNPEAIIVEEVLE